MKLSTKALPFQPGRNDKFRCLFCGGAKCKRCGTEAYLQLQNPAFHGLHSTWITENILAMQRPSNLLFKTFNLIEKFVEKRVVAIFNLTEPGEHPYCGDGILDSSGFPYCPEILMKAGSKFCFLFISLISVLANCFVLFFGLISSHRS